MRHRRRIDISRRPLIAILALLVVSCSSNPPPTPVASVADVATKIEQSANVILHATEAGTMVIVPSTGKPLISRDQLDVVALAINRLGHLGITLKTALDDYNAVKAAGSDLTAQRIAVQQILVDVSAALNGINKAIPMGTLQAVDGAINTIFTIIASVKGAGAGL